MSLKIRRAGVVEVDFGNEVTIIEPVNLYNCSIGESSFIGPFVEIQRGVVVGKRCRIQSHTFICELVRMGDDCFVGHGVMFVNDLFANGGPSQSPADWKSTEIGDRVSIGSNATILPVRIASGIVIGSGSVVTKDLLIPGTYAGNPAKLLKPFGA